MKRHLFLAAHALVAAGCCRTPQSKFPTADDALARMKASYACVNGVQGNAKIDNFAPKAGRIRGEVYLLAVNPARVRFDVVSPFGATLFTLTSDGTDFQMLDLKEKRFLEGPASTCNLARLTQVPVPGHALVSLLRGEAPVLVHQPADAQIAWDCKGYYRLLVRSTRDAVEEIHLEVRPEDFDKPWNQQRVRVRDVRIAQRGVDLYQAELKNHEAAKTAPTRVDPEGIDPDIPPIGSICDAELPRSIRIQVPNTQQDAIFQYKEAKWNPPIVPGAFQQPVPSGVHRQRVTCDDSLPNR